MLKTQNINDAITKFIRSHEFEPRMLEQKVFALWQTVLDPPFSTNLVPVSISDGILKVYTEHPVYVSELSFLKPKIIADLNAELGEPALTALRIELRPARAETPRQPANEKRAKTASNHPNTKNTRPPTAEELEQIEQALTCVTDTELETSLRQLFLTQSAHKP